MSANPVGIHLSNLSIHYTDSPLPTIAELNMTLPPAKWTVLLGPSGSGKTTLFRYLAGLLDGAQCNGEIVTSDNQPIANRIAYMAQQDLLLPWLNVIENVCLGAKFTAKKIDPIQLRARALELLRQVGLANEAEERPSGLSGGMRQRVALARTLMLDRPIVLMDEPFSAVDAVTRHKLQSLAVELLRDKTVVLITHDPQEAVRLAHNLYVLNGEPARAQSLATPDSSPPRRLDTDCAAMQQAIFDQLEREDD